MDHYHMTLPHTKSTIFRCMLNVTGNKHRLILKAPCYTDRQQSVINTYMHGEAQTPLGQFVEAILYKQFCNKYSALWWRFFETQRNVLLSLSLLSSVTRCHVNVVTPLTDRFMFRCILTYEVEFSYYNIPNSFKRINSHDTVFTSFLYDRSLENLSGLYICYNDIRFFLPICCWEILTCRFLFIYTWVDVSTLQCNIGVVIPTPAI